MRLSKNELKHLRSLGQKKVRQAQKRFVLEGWRALKDLLNTSWSVDLVAVLPVYLENPDYKNILDQVRQRKIPLREISEKEMRQVSETVHAQGVVAIVEQEHHTLSASILQKASLVVAADGMSDPGNLGSLLRTADWFGVDLVLLGNGSVELYNDKVIRSTVGSLFHVPVVEGISLPASLRDLRAGGFRVIALSGDGEVDADKAEWGTKTALVLGSEAHGLSRDVRGVADSVVRIPRAGKAESLNVVVAAGIVLSHLRRKS